MNSTESNNINSSSIVLPDELNELKLLKQWVGYITQSRNNGKVGKIPINPSTGNYASANDCNTWGTYDEAVKALSLYPLVGIGFEFANGYTGIDLDDVVLENGELNEFALKIINDVDSYTEYSPSGNGIHIICKNTFEIGNKNTKLGLEIYSTKRFFTITGNVYGTVKPISERTEQVMNIYHKYFSHQTIEISKLPENFNIPEDDNQLWDIMFSSKSTGAKIKKLFDGDIDDMKEYKKENTKGEIYTDLNSVDLAMCNYLAFWTKGNRVRMDRMFRQTGLMRGKWLERRVNSTYGMNTINKALEFYSASSTDNVSNTENEIQEGSECTLNYSYNVVSSVVSEPQEQYEHCVVKYLNNFENDLAKFQNSSCSTGFNNIDTITKGLYPALYVLGASTSMGKTTFALQLADQIAQSGRPIIYFSLEQNKMELLSKSFSRIIASQMLQHGQELKNAISSVDLPQYIKDSRFLQAKKYYNTFAQNINIITSTDYNINTATIRCEIENYIDNFNTTPIIFIDYLQILQNQNYTKDTKEKIDDNVRELKRIQDKYQLIMFVISSVNRQSYNNSFGLDSAKETGSIEYTANVVWGLQPEIMSNISFNKNSEKEKEKLIEEAKSETPRKMELICVKNRAGICPYHCYFDYYANCDYFVPRTISSSSKSSKRVI